MSASTIPNMHRQDCADTGCGGCFPDPSATLIPKGLSADRKRTLRREAELAAGVHPTTKRPLLHAEWGFTCGSCAHHLAHRRASTFHKCEAAPGGLSHGPASDVRVSWPACALYAIDPEDHR